NCLFAWSSSTVTSVAVEQQHQYTTTAEIIETNVVWFLPLGFSSYRGFSA
ncbi:hypothetical protein WUBG_17640, partial [Wuchereria bancrofti]